MNGHDLFPSITLVFVDQATWSRVFPARALSFARCHQEISACGRRLLKGVNRAQERMRLLQWSDRLQDLVREAGSQVSMGATMVPGGRAADWCRMLALLGRHRAWCAAKNFEKEQLPYFLPCLWAPVATGRKSPARSTFEPTVGSHLGELEQMKRILNKMPAGSPPTIMEMVAVRVRAFRQALESQSGVVEVVGALLESSLPEQGADHE